MQKEECIKLQNALKPLLNYNEIVDISSTSVCPVAPPITAAITVTSRCNSNCKYCTFRASMVKDRIDVPDEKIKEIITDMADIGVKVLTLTGGEPLLRKDLPILCEYAKNVGIDVHITTNGLLLSNEWAEKLNSCGVTTLVMSLDSLDNSIYSAHRGVSNERALNALNTLNYFAGLKKGNMCAITYVVSKKNYRELCEFVRFIKDSGSLALVNIQPYHKPVPTGSGEETNSYSSQPESEVDELTPGENDREEMQQVVNELIRMKSQGFPINNSVQYLNSIPDFLIRHELPEGHCYAGYTGLCVDENLNVKPCWHMPPITNLQDHRLKDIWFSDEYSMVRARMTQRKCPKCMLLCHNEQGWYDWYNLYFKK